MIKVKDRQKNAYEKMKAKDLYKIAKQIQNPTFKNHIKPISA